MNILFRYRGQIILALLVVVSFLVAANLIKYAQVSKSTIIENKDLIDVVLKAVGSILLVIGAVASYYRFFRGRTFAARANLELEVSVFDTVHDFKLHVIDFQVTNIGNVPIWQPRPVITVHMYGPSDLKTYDIDNWWHPMWEKKNMSTTDLIDSQESAQFYASQHIPLDVWAVTYTAAIETRGRNVWRKSVTVSNRVESGGSKSA
jgi:hypothetical protein